MADQTEHELRVHRYTKNTYGVDCTCGWTVTITTKNAFGTTEGHARAWAKAHAAGQPRPNGYQVPTPKPEEGTTTKLWVTNNNTDDLVELVENALDPEVCESCGAEVRTYVVTAEDETWRMAECLPCLVKVADNIRPAKP